MLSFFPGNSPHSPFFFFFLGFWVKLEKESRLPFSLFHCFVHCYIHCILFFLVSCGPKRLLRPRPPLTFNPVTMAPFQFYLDNFFAQNYSDPRRQPLTMLPEARRTNLCLIGVTCIDFSAFIPSTVYFVYFLLIWWRYI